MSSLSKISPTEGKRFSFQADAAVSSGETVSLKTNGNIEPTSNGDLDGFLGIAQSDIGIGETGVIIMRGGFANNLSGLTPNSIYYVQSNGTLSTSSSSMIAGKALTSTSLNLEYNS